MATTFWFKIQAILTEIVCFGVIYGEFVEKKSYCFGIKWYVQAINLDRQKFCGRWFWLQFFLIRARTPILPYWF